MFLGGSTKVDRSLSKALSRCVGAQDRLVACR